MEFDNNTILDKKEEFENKQRDLFLNAVKDKKSNKIIIKKTKKIRDPSVDEVKENVNLVQEQEEIKGMKPEEKKEEEKKEEKKSPKMKGRLNESFADILEELAKYMTKRGEPFRSRAYQKAQETIVLHVNEINENNYQQLVSLPNIGPTIIQKFKEYIETGTLRLLEKERANPQNIFSEIYGIGPKKAKDLVEKNITSIVELREKQNEVLNDTQKIGLKYYEDILKRIPRSEIDEYKTIFDSSFENIKTSSSDMEIVGSYRRGAKTSGDIDVIITSEEKEIFKHFMDNLLEKKIIIELLTRGPTKSLVITRLSENRTPRRVDFLYTSKEEYPFAVLYFTGSKTFNTVMRGRALSMGYSLNEHGMYKMEGKKKGSKVDTTFLTEKDIFDFLKMEYKEPNERVDGRSVVPLKGSPKLVVPEVVETLDTSSKKEKPVVQETQNNKEMKKEEREKRKKEEQTRKLQIKEMIKKEKEELKNQLKKEKEDQKTRKKREKEIEKEKKKKEKQEERTRKKREKDTKKIEVKENKGNTTRKKMPTTRSGKTTEKCPIQPLNVHTKDPILHVIQNYKDGGISVLENLNEKTLNEMLVKTNEVYRNLGPNEQPLISDNQYDILEDFIKQKYPKNQVIGKIGAPVEKNKVKLPYEMASMDKIKPDTKALPSWKAKYSGPYVLSCKLDGVSGLYTTENNQSALYTRGDGKVGQNISHFIPYLDLPKKKDIVVRGEFIMQKQIFTSKYADKFANARNLIAGTVNRLTVNDTINDMHFVAYEVIKPEIKPSEQMQLLNEMGFITVKNETRQTISNEDLSKLLVDWRSNYDYEIDGVIVTNDKIYSRKTGNPDHSFAFKMALSDQMAEAKVLDVEWNASKDGYLKPKIRIEPVKLGGVTIERATGFNAAFIESNKIGVGALIEIIRSGDVIPYIRSVITPAEQPQMPSVNYIWNDTHVDILLENKNTNENVRNKNIAGFFKGLDIEGLGDKNVVKIVDAGYDSVSKILKMTKDQLLTIDGFKEKMAQKLYNNIQDTIYGNSNKNIQEASLAKIMAVSNMFGRGFSDKKIELILSEYPDILTSNESEVTKIDKLTDIKGMASKTAEAFVKQIPEFLGFLQECNLEGKLNISKNVAQVDSSHELYDKSVVMSGTRDKDIESGLKKVGAKLATSVTSKTFAVITPDPESDTGKVANAKKLNIPIFTPNNFKDKYKL